VVQAPGHAQGDDAGLVDVVGARSWVSMLVAGSALGRRHTQ
jgi:hypothetical protein